MWVGTLQQKSNNNEDVQAHANLQVINIMTTLSSIQTTLLI